jgi:hypothetical protein
MAAIFHEIRIPILSLLAVVCTGCATQTVNFTSSPSGARVEFDGHTGKTPCKLKGSRRCNVAVVFYGDRRNEIHLPDSPPSFMIALASTGHGAANLCHGVSYPFIIFGSFGLELCDFSSDDFEEEIVWFIFSGGSLMIGGLVDMLGNCIDDAFDFDETHVHIKFVNIAENNGEGGLPDVE